MNKKNLFHFFATLFIAACVLSTTNKINAAPEESISEVEIEESLLFLGTDSFAPYSFLDKNIPTGYAVDLTKVLSATLDKKIKIELKPWKECLSDLKVGKADGLIGAPVSEEFPKFITYSIPVAKLDFAIFVETSNKYVNSLKSLEGTVVGVSEHSPIIDTLKKNGRLKLVITPSTLDAFKKIKQREVTAVIAEKEVALYCIRQNRIKNLKIIGCPVGPIYEYALAISSNKQHLLKDVNIAIGTMTKNDMLSYLKRKWFGIKLVEPFPWKKVSIVIGIITGILLLMMGVLWVISLNATVRTKTRQIQLMSEKMIAKDKLAVLGKLAGQIAHELRTPLSIISNSVFLLHKEGTKNRELFEKRLKILEDKIKLSSNILESILSYSRVKAEIATIISVKDCIEEVVKDMEIPAGIKKKISYENEDFLAVFMDFHQLYSVLRNLVLNALQVMDNTGTLRIQAFAEESSNTAVIRICDTGLGILEGTKNKIFNLFYSSKITGTGLGLPISKSIIESNEGVLYLEETSKKGSCFVIKLPSAKKIET